MTAVVQQLCHKPWEKRCVPYNLSDLPLFIWSRLIWSPWRINTWPPCQSQPASMPDQLQKSQQVLEEWRHSIIQPVFPLEACFFCSEVSYHPGRVTVAPYLTFQFPKRCDLGNEKVLRNGAHSLMILLSSVWLSKLDHCTCDGKVTGSNPWVGMVVS